MRPFIYSLLLIICVLNLTAQEEIAPTVYPFAYQGKWGIIDADKNVLLEPSIDHIDLFYNRRSPNGTTSATQDGRMGILTREGRWQLRPRYDSVGQAQYRAQHLRWVQQDGKYGLVSTQKRKARFLIKPRFDEVSSFEGRQMAVAVVSQDGRQGAVNMEGDILADLIYDEVDVVDDFSDFPDLRLVLNGEVSYIDCWGKPRTDEQMEDVLEEAEFWDMVVEEAEVYDGGASVPDPTVDYRRAGENTWQVTSKAYSWQSGQLEPVNDITLEGYSTVEDARIYDDGRIYLIRVSRDGKQGFLDAAGEVVTPISYDAIEPYQGNPKFGWELRLGQSIGLAKFNGQQLFPALFSSIKPTHGQLFLLETADGYLGYGERNGTYYLPIGE